MTVDPGDVPEQDDARTPQAGARRPDAGHLDDDPEAMEDPVHSGDAQHQHELHERASDRTD